MAYRNQVGMASTRTLSPYGLSFFEGRWYVVGHDSTSDAQRVFALTRIEDAELLKETFVHPTDFRISDHITLPFALIGTQPLGAVTLIISEARAHQARAITRNKGTLKPQDDGSLLWTVEYSDIEVLARYIIEYELVFADPDCAEAQFLRDRLDDVARLALQ